MRRPQILASAIELVREKGIWNVRISDVAERAGLSPTSVVYYYGTKEQLLAAAITGADDAFYAPVEAELAGLRQAADRLACIIVRSSLSDWLLSMDLWVFARHHPETAIAQRGLQRRWRQLFEEVITYGLQTDAWSPSNPRDAAQRLSALTDGLAVHMVLGDPDHTRERYVSMSLTAAACELNCDLGQLERAAARLPMPEPRP